MALPMGELARLKAVTERVPCSNHGTFPEFAAAFALSGSLIARQLPHRGSQGAGVARPVVSPAAITAHIPNLRLRSPSQARCSLASSPIGGAKGGCAAGFPPSYPLRWASIARPIWWVQRGRGCKKAALSGSFFGGRFTCLHPGDTPGCGSCHHP